MNVNKLAILGTLLPTLLLGTGLLSTGAQAATATRTSGFTYLSTSGLLEKEIIEPASSVACLVTVYTPDAYGNKTVATTRNCNGSTGEAAAPAQGTDPVIATRATGNTFGVSGVNGYTGDAHGQFPTTSTNALGQSETKTYDNRFGAVTALTGPNSLTTSWSYDSFGRKILETRADGTKTKLDYLYCSGFNNGTASCPTIGGAVGAYLVQTTPLATDGVTPSGPISKIYYDDLDRQIRSETQGFDGTGTSTPIYVDTQYDNRGRAYKTSRPYYSGQTAYWTTFNYDDFNRVILETPPDPTTVVTTQTVYNGLTVTVSTNAIAGAVAQSRITLKNSQGQTARVTDTQGNQVNYTYDPFGNLATTQDALGNVTTLRYDGRGRKYQMVDPDMGTWNYYYDALGELIRQTDALGKTSTLVYDLLGRMTNRSEADLISNWYFDAYKGGGACNKGIGKLCQAETSIGYNRTHYYDNYGRASSTATTLDTVYNVGASYDPTTGRMLTQSYPGGLTGLTVKYVYTALGYLKEIRDNTSNALYWQANTLDAEGHMQQQTYGNNVITNQNYNPSSGRLGGIVAGAGNGVQNLGYTYDGLGNMLSRVDWNQSLTETFGYDNLNRLTTSTVNSSGAGIVTLTYGYDTIGNIKSRSDVGNYVYNPSGVGSVQPHALAQVNFTASGAKFTAGDYRKDIYDLNGNLSQENYYSSTNVWDATRSRTENYTSFNMPTSMGSYGLSNSFYYGPEHQRVQQTVTNATTNPVSTTTTYYLNPGNNGDLLFEKDLKSDNTTEQRNFITAYGQVVAIVKLTNGTTWSTRYLHRDNLNSVTAITNEAGTVVERLAYEPYGKRRFANGSNDPSNTILPQNTARGFTGHEHLDDLGLIHMNGRIYDPVVGRFMSADPNIQAPGNLQSYNRYAYVMNNPLMYSDPSGYSAWTTMRDTAIRIGAAVADAYFCSGYCSAAVGAYQGYRQGGDKGAIAGAIAGYVGYQVSVNYPLTDSTGINWANVATASEINAATGCAGAAAAGGDCARGALEGAAGTVGSAFGLKGSIIAGCAAGMVSGGGCSEGALNALGPYAIYSAVGYITGSQQKGGAASADEALRANGDSVPLVESFSPTLQLTEIFPPTFLLTEPPIEVIPPRAMVPFEELPIGSSGAPGAGKVFRGTNPYPEGTPCRYCGRPTTREPGPTQLHRDHVIPRDGGRGNGNNTDGNRVPSCRDCNIQKRNRTPQQWYKDNDWAEYPTSRANV